MDKYMSVCSYVFTMTPKSETACACPDCKCEVTPGHHVAKDGKDFSSNAIVSPGAENKFTVKLTKTGTYTFQCDYHVPDMVGTITVQ